MKKICLLVLLVSFNLLLFSQSNFEEAYFINNFGEKVKCYIKNKDWGNNPSKFQYKILNDGVTKFGNLDSVQEFGTNKFNFKRFNVLIDRSKSDVNNYSKKREPEFHNELLFLKTIIEGKASLYYFKDKSKILYFYKTDKQDVKQLIYKKYIKIRKTPDNLDKLIYLKNETYKDQLLSDLKCVSILATDIISMEYSQKHLSKIFILYNECQNSDFQEFKKKKIQINLSLRPRYNYSSFSMERLKEVNNYNFNVDFGSQFNYSLGFELEMILPMNNDKWSLYLEPSYRYFKANKEITYFESGLFIKKSAVKIDYKSFSTPVGLRYYIFFNNNFKLFFNTGITLNYLYKPEYIYDNEDIEAVIYWNDAISTHLGFGLKYNDRFSVEIRSGNKETIIRNSTYWDEHYLWDNDYRQISLILGYTL